MNTPICRTCGCSLVRLGISLDASSTHEYAGERHHFCCPACVDLFKTDPKRYLDETSDLIVCPTCLAEKPLSRSTALIVDQYVVHLCRCPYCAELFQKDPSFYMRRLEGATSGAGVLDHEGCCVRPEQN